MSGFYQNGYRVPMFRDRRATSIENDALRVTVLHEGGHIAQILDKRTGINPLWIPPWPSIEPSAIRRGAPPGVRRRRGRVAARRHHGPQPVSRHLRRALDRRSRRWPAGARRGVRPPGSRSTPDANQIAMNALLPAAQLRVERRIVLADRVVHVHERVENLSATDRPIGWTQHVTLGPPFLEKGATEFRASATRSRVFEGVFGLDDTLVAGADFDWPLAPRLSGGSEDLAHLHDRATVERLHRASHGPGARRGVLRGVLTAAALAFGYVWRRADFPWMGIWDENHSRTAPPWNGRTLTRGLSSACRRCRKRGGR